MSIAIQHPPRMPDPPELRLGADANLLMSGGVNYKKDPTQVRDNQSPYMVNMFAIDRGSILNKRDGQAYVYASSLGGGGINGAYERLYQGVKVFAWGTAIYTQSGTSAPVSIMSGLANAKGSFFAFGGLLYYINGTNFVVISDTLTAAAVTPYVPTLLISTTPTGSGTPYEQANLLTPSFKISFSADGAATKFYFPFTGLDAAAVTVMVNGAAKTEGTHFTVNRTATPYAYVDFAAGTSPTGIIATGAPNNVIVTAAKTTAGNEAKVKNCRYAIDYGGDNDTRVFLWGNPSYPNRAIRSGLMDPTYWPENEFSDVGSASERLVACAKHYDKLVYLKERSLYFTTYTNPVTQGFWGASQIGASFPLYPINSAVGCDMPGSVQIIDNNIVFGNSDLGLFILLSTQVKDERDVRPISGNINGAPTRPGLLDLSVSDLQAASSVDFDGRYWLCVGNQAFVWDYRLSPFADTGDVAADEDRLSWFPQTNIKASCWIQDDRALYYGDRTTGRVVTFQPNYNDFGQPIPAVWQTKRFSFGLPDWLKTIKKAWFTSKAGGYSTVNIKYITEKGEKADSEDVNVNSFRWNTATWATWTWAVNEYPPPERIKPKMKKVVYFQIEFSNGNLNQNLSLMSLVIQYMVVKKVK
ncbi:hypothetical protein GXP70_12450 [Paenibacillus lycopersici]|uniref:Uncharacterized protein n=1 Tax=Paenibacillus lycopersici TaxID=2704462 RepID=A0A6C0FYX2_9BACL|nr:hypothetical protein [Paenibacillus lycopersici]QHT60671.1 hypothetical protein GXP70_12450 [Paenibacillus lycopersici]